MEVCEDLDAKILMHIVGSGWCKSRGIGRNCVSDVKPSITLERQPRLRVVSVQLTEFKDGFWINDFFASRPFSSSITPLYRQLELLFSFFFRPVAL